MVSSGIVLLDKPAGISSAGVLRSVQKKLSIDKIGHAGTLDPMATGLLVVLIGHATRCAQFAEDGEKEYEATFLWGQETSTDDIEGEILNQSDRRPTIEEIRHCLTSFIGTIDQVPPKISSIKINGERAYARARRGEVFDIPARKVTIFHIVEVAHSLDSFTCIVRCGPGTYIRSIARDLGRALGTYGTMSALRRRASFPFDVTNAVGIEELTIDRLLPLENLFPNTKIADVSTADAKALQQGKSTALEMLSNQYPDEQLMLYRTKEGPILGILRRMEGEKHLRIGCNFPVSSV